MADTPLYKTPDEYLLLAIDRLRALGAPISDFNVGSGARTLFEGLATMVSAHSLQLEQLRLDTRLATAGDSALDALAANYRVARKAAVPATGTVTITRQITAGAFTVPAGSVQLATRSTPTQASQSYLTSEDAVFADTVASVTVPAIATIGGTAGNLASGVVLITVDAINSVDADGGVVVAAAFTGGVDVETDAALRRRIPLEVQGREKGSTAAYLAAALRVPGVSSAQVLRAGETGQHGTLAGGAVEVYYEGEAGLLSQVDSEVANAAAINDNPASYTAPSERLVATVTVFVLAGTDHAATSDAVKAALIANVAAVDVGQTVYASTAIEAVHNVSQVVSLTVPLADHRKFSDPGGTTGNVAIAAGKVATLAATDITVTVTDL